MMQQTAGRWVQWALWAVAGLVAALLTLGSFGLVGESAFGIAAASKSDEAGAPPKDKHVAAEFLGVHPDDLAVGQDGRVTVDIQSWGEQRTRIWKLYRQGGDGERSVDASAVVDIDDDVVVRALWDNERYWRRTEAEHREDPLSRDECRLHALNFLWQKVPFFSWPEHLTYHGAGREEYGVTGCLFRWGGSTARLRQARVYVTVSPASGRPVRYFLSRWAQPPAPTSEIKLTRNEAKRIIQDYVPEDTEVLSIDVGRLWTFSAFAPPGEPVYLVSLLGRRPLPQDPDSHYGLAELYGVHGTTGQVLTDAREEWGEPLGSWSEKIDDDTRSRVKRKGAEAKDILRDHLPADWLNPNVSIRTLTSDTRFAPKGEPVYTMYVSYQKQTAEGETKQMRTTCGVHAVTGEVFGTPADQRRPRKEPPGEAPNE
ncbi:MAG: hypothetical protein U9Q79_10910 [Candidatus Hydrogenedentes bacterium]|nr:hypothetical protein [Candidatus Hydrogenedentota bacterium]